MKIVTYNLHFGGKGRVHWNEIIEQFAPDIFLVQESFEPKEHLTSQLHDKRHEQAVWSPVESNGKSKGWGSAVFIESYTPIPIDLRQLAGWVVGAEVAQFSCPDGEQRRLRIFSLHAPTGTGSYQQVVNSILDMLLEYLDGCDVVIGGDFNLTVSERHASEEKQTQNSDLKIQARLRDEFGLINCWQTANPDLPLSQTLRWDSNRTIPFHCDGLFVPKSWRPHLQSCDVVTGSRWDELSDHDPVVAEFELAGDKS